METGKRNTLFHFLLAWVALLIAALACSNDPTPTPTLTPTPTPTSTPYVITSPGVVKRIGSVSILQTTLFRIDTVVRAKKEGDWPFNWGGQNLLLFVQGTVTAGIDLGELTEDNVEVSQDTRTIVVTLPSAKVLSAVLDDHQVETYEGERPDEVNLDLLEEGLAAGRQQIATTACESGILQYATKDAEAAFVQIMSLADFADYEVVVETAPVNDCNIVVE